MQFRSMSRALLPMVFSFLDWSTSMIDLEYVIVIIEQITLSFYNFRMFMEQID